MTDQPEAAGSEAVADTSELTLEQAREMLDPIEEGAEDATAEEELLVEGKADPEKDPGTDEEVEAVKDPPIDRPKSWSKDEDAEWQSLPRAMQQKIVARELERDTGTTRSQQEAANARKAAEAERAQAEQARKQYEAAKLDAVATLEREQQRDFPDIRSMDDVRNLQRNDPFRFQEWQIHQMSLAAAVAEKQSIEGRQRQEKQTEAQERKAREHSLLIEKAPEYADSKKLDDAQKAAVEMFREKGCTDDWFKENGNNPLMDDHRFQLIVADALKYRAIQNAPKPVAAKPLPPVQRPGVARPAGAAISEEIKTLTDKLNRTGSIRDAEALLNAQERARERRAS